MLAIHYQENSSMPTPAHDPPMLTSNRNGRIAFGVSPVGVLASPEIAHHPGPHYVFTAGQKSYGLIMRCDTTDQWSISSMDYHSRS